MPQELDQAYCLLVLAPLEHQTSVTVVQVVTVVILYDVGSVVDPTRDSCLFLRSATVNRVHPDLFSLVERSHVLSCFVVVMLDSFVLSSLSSYFVRTCRF